MKKKFIFLLMMFCLLFVMTSCGGEEVVDKSRIYKLYGVNKDETKIISKEYIVNTTEQSGLIEELLAKLSDTPEKLEYKPPLAGEYKLLNYSVEEGQLILNLDEHYKELPVTTEVLVRAAIVRTMTQVKGIDYVSFYVNDVPLTDNDGNVLLTMSADMFIDNAGSEINSHEKATLRLYFANKEGNKLIGASRKLVYNTNISMEKLIVEQLISGPSEQMKNEIYPTINPDTKVISATIKDGICYVNLSEQFLTTTSNVTSEVTIYSLANSLVELPNVNKVQIAVDGETNLMFRENISLVMPFERNLDIVTTAE
ncbi:GerMN domain-containing protein [Kineothrix sp. MB12-C1]|uniref:GerMN domain-containing protein n=1 Tax=Kineothrix sp. MB12-C1 TaxID=3070215 RepID=UPI0027D30DE8|nr:GerMN domain-containing protein [Kineothrix sp. MB12-C1]WMC92007.1 GerMN domain-containing protein [Kineothrix sp. MB12-C1]